MAFFAGKDGSITVNGSATRIKSWDGKFQGDTVDVTSTGIPPGDTLSGFRERIVGLRHAEGTFVICLDGSAIPTFQDGDLVALILLYNTTSTKGWSVPRALIKEMAPKVAVDGNVELTVSWESSGSYAKQ